MMVTLIDENGKKFGEVNIHDAERKAKEVNKDLVMVDHNVYRIVDSGKLKYEKNRKKKQQKVNNRAHKIKEIKFGLLTDVNDMNIKARRIREFLKKGIQTKVTMFLKGRQAAFKDAGLSKMLGLISPIIQDGLATISKEPSFEGSNITAFLTPIQK